MARHEILAALDTYDGTIHQLSGDDLWTGDRIRGAITRLAESLGEEGISRAERVALSAGNGVPFLVALGACLEIGATPILCFPAAPGEELERTAERWCASWILVDRSCPGLGGSVRSAVDPGLEYFLSRGVEEGLQDLSGIPLHGTSGTSGVPKMALRPGPCALEEARHYIETLGIGSGERILSVVPTAHAYGYGMCLMVPILASAHLVVAPVFHPRQALRTLAAESISLLPATPAMLELMVKAAGPDGSVEPSPRVLTAGAPLAAATADVAEKLFGRRPGQLYGTTETGGISVDVDPRPGRLSVGPAMHGVEVEVRPQDEEQRKNGLGHLFVRSSSMMAGYLGPQGVDTEVLDEGWFDTGDLAHIDGDGHLFLHGRQSEVLNVFGHKVIPSEVEEVIAALVGVREVKVYGRRRADGSQDVRAAVVAGPQIDAATVAAFCRQRLSAYKVPHKVELLDALPRNAAGKIASDELP